MLMIKETQWISINMTPKKDDDKKKDDKEDNKNSDND